MATTRQIRVQNLLKEEISDILRREFKDPRLGFITIIDAQVSPDLRHAKIFVSVLGTEEEKALNLNILNKAKYFIRQAVGKRVVIKTLPEIEFVMDTSVDKSVKMLELLEGIKREQETQDED